ncbi:MAG: heme-binding protein [Chromatiales bacterium]|jgi:uncharacterized protein GlcG (DUF336 family)
MAETLGLAEAQEVVRIILEEGEKRGYRMAGAVVDFGGDLVCLNRADGASALNARMSYNKGYTAVKWQNDTIAIRKRLFDMSLGDARREVSWFGDPLYTPVPGGILLRNPAGVVLGALGESGAPAEVDEEIGRVAQQAFENL